MKNIFYVLIFPIWFVSSIKASVIERLDAARDAISIAKNDLDAHLLGQSKCQKSCDGNRCCQCRAN